MSNKLKVNEIFYSLQGEGARVGEPSIFIRLSKCNLSCIFCDTEFESQIEMSIDEIKKEISKYPASWIVWTGGEPTLQLNKEVVSHFRNYKQAIETNGTNPIDYNLDWICVSPKVAEHVVAKNFKKVNELKYVMMDKKPLPQPSIKADHYFLSPMAVGDYIPAENMKHCIKLCLENPQWKMTMQNHKIWSVR